MDARKFYLDCWGEILGETIVETVEEYQEWEEKVGAVRDSIENLAGEIKGDEVQNLLVDLEADRFNQPLSGVIDEIIIKWLDEQVSKGNIIIK